MKKKLRKVNNNSDSLYITIPKYVVDNLELKANQEIDLEVKSQKIILNTKVEE